MLKKISVLLFILCTTMTFGKEYNVEVTVEKNETITNKEIDLKLRAKGLEEALFQKIKEDGLNLEIFKSKLTEKNFSSENYMTFLESFYQNAEVIRLVGADAKNDLASNPKAVFKGEIDETNFKNKFVELTEGLEIFKEKNFYIDVDLNLQGNTKWDDLGVGSSDIFIESLTNSWRDIFIKDFPDFKNIIFMEDKERKYFDGDTKLVPKEALRLKFSASIRKNFENASTKKTNFDVDAHYVLVSARDNSVLVSYDYPTQQKDFKNVNKKDLSSSMASFIFNLLKTQTKFIQNATTNVKATTDSNFILKGQSFFSDIYKAQSALVNYLSKIKGQVVVKKLNISETILSITFENSTADASKLAELLNSMGKLPLSSEVTEQKVLIFNPSNNSFAITQKD